MYGLAGHQHTPGMPELSALGKSKSPLKSRKGLAGQRTLRNKESAQRYKDGKYKKVHYGEA